MSPPSLGKQRSVQTEMKGKQMTLMAAFKDGDTAFENSRYNFLDVDLY